jgi:hypothetical protein
MKNKLEVRDLVHKFGFYSNIKSITGVNLDSLCRYKKQGYIPKDIASFIISIAHQRGYIFIKHTDIDWINYNKDIKINKK